jgi:hypothetical protein
MCDHASEPGITAYDIPIPLVQTTIVHVVVE